MKESETMLRAKCFFFCLSVVLLLLAATAVQAGYMTTVLGDNPVGYWRLGETGTTTAINSGSSGVAQNGAANSGVVLGAIGGGTHDTLDPDKAATFNSGNVNITDSSPFNFTQNDPFTLEAWARITDKTNTLQGVVGKWGAQSSPVQIDKGYNLSLTSSWGGGENGRFLPVFHINGIDSTGLIDSGMAEEMDTADLGDGNWHHLAVTKAAGKTLASVHMYVDGLEVTTQLWHNDSWGDLADMTNTRTVLIGQRGMPADALAGGIDEVAIYNRVLSATEIHDHFLGVPEPSALVLLATGVLGLLAYAWRKRR
jgi:hypothetical protein